MHLSSQDIQNLSRIQRLNIINSCTGIKPANLIATKSPKGQPNVGIFSSVVHLGSDPALIGFFFRPQHEKPRDTYLNIQSTNYFTINHVPLALTENAHFTSAKFPHEVSEFQRCGLTEEYLHDFHAPFVKESPLKIALEKVDEITIPANKTILMIGKILHLIFPDDIMDSDGNLNLETAQTTGISGVNTYYQLQKHQQYPYAHLDEVPDFSND